jgi:phosphatidate cytidylyltransferase
MMTRIVTGIILASAALWATLAGPTWLMQGALVLVAAICVYEIVAMAMPVHRLDHMVGALSGVILVGTAAFGAPEALSFALGAALLLPSVAVLLRPEPLPEAAQRLCTLWGSLFYVGGCFWFILTLAENPHHLVLAFIVVFAGDTGAYFVGRAVGRHKLYPRISPKKTWEGAFGGLAASVAGAFFGGAYLAPDLAVPSACAMGALGGATGQIGDLVESTLKRACGVKDSGRLLPGHGGFLDRVDGLLLAAPVLVFFL